MKYDPGEAPDPKSWREEEEPDRIDAVLRYHRHAGVKLPNARLHAAIHDVIESQVAMGDETPVRGTVERLQAEGLDRHEAIHAVGSVLVRHMRSLMEKDVPAGDPNDEYWAELKQLSAKEWWRVR